MKTPLFSVLLLCASSAAFASPLSVSVELSDRQVEVGDIVTMQVTAAASQNGDLQVELPKFPKGIEEISRSRSESTSISFINGQQSLNRQVITSLELEITGPGNHTIPPVKATLGRHRAESGSASLEVGESAIAVLEASATGIAPPTREEGNVFVRYRLDKATAFIGEQVLLDLEIFTRPGVSFSLEQSAVPPELDGFWREVVDQPKQPPRRVATINGHTYHAYRIWRLALFPLTAKAHEIASVRLTMSQGRSILGRGQRLRRRSLPVRFEVKSLPTSGRPKDFVATNVGSYTLRASVDHARVPAGKAILLSLLLRGRGNVQASRLPAVRDIDGFRVFPPTSEESIQRSTEGVTGTKKVDVLLMPTRGGRLEIPRFSMSVFDPAKGAYRSLTTETLRVFVEGEPVAVASAEDGDQAKKKASLQPIRVGVNSELAEAAPWTQSWWWAGMGAPWILLALVFVVRRVRRVVKQETPARRRKAVSKGARRRLNVARAKLAEDDVPGAYTAFSEAVLELGSERIGTPLRGLTLEEIDNLLSEHGAPASLVGPLLDELRTADFARFAQGAVEGRSAEQLEQRWTRIVAALETLDVGSSS